MIHKILWAGMLWLLAVKAVAAPAKERRLLIINSYHETAPWTQEMITPITFQLAQQEGIYADIIHLSSILIRNKELYDRMEESLFQRYADRKPDYLVLIGAFAFSLRDRIVREWGDIPIVVIAKSDKYGPKEYYFTGQAAGITDAVLKPMADLREQYNFTLVEVPDYYRETIDMMVQMLPRMKKLIFMADENWISRYTAGLIRSYIASRYPDLEYIWCIGNRENSHHLQQHLIEHDPTVGLLFSTWFYEYTNVNGFLQLMSGDTRLISASLQSVFALRSAYLEDGVTGGYFPDPEQVQHAIINAVTKMTEGRSMRDIPFAYATKSFPIINYSRLVLEKIPETLCPKNTVFINKPLTFWQQYTWQIIVGLAVIVMLITVSLLISLFQRKKIGLLNKFNSLVDNMPIAYTQAAVCFSTEGNVIDIDYHSGNESFAELLRKNSIPGQPNKLFPAQYISEFTETMLKSRLPVTFTYYFKQTDTYYEFLICLIKKGKNIKYQEENNIDIFAVDITARSKSENKLRKFAQKLDLVLSLARIIPWRWNLQTGRISCEAQRVLKHMNFKIQPGSTHTTHIIKDSEYFDRIHPDDAPRIKSLYTDLLVGRLQYVKAEFRVLSDKNGKEEIDWIEVNATVTEHDERQHPSVLSGSLLLITERKKQELALIDAREQAKESDRLKSVFLANMSHEIRTPLNAIVGFSNLLGKTDDAEKKRKFMGIIENNNQLLLQLIGDVLDLAKVEANTLDFYYQPVDLNDLMRTIENSVRLRVKPEVELVCIPGAEECHLETEPNRLAQVLINLLTNASKFTMQGNITFGYEMRDGELYFFVKDTGMGISKENQARLFQRFSKLNNFVQGTGLGLSISKGIIEKMGGNIGVCSEGEGKGCTFWFTIPYRPVSEIKNTVAEEELKDVVSRKDITVLVAEDNESNYLLFQSILEAEYKLIHAWDGAEAVELYKEHSPQIIIMDINMPNMDGYEATREIRKLNADVPIIAVTAYAFASDKKRIMENGFNGYVSKPLDANKLMQELKSMLGKTFIML